MINAFKEIRLTNTDLQASNNRLIVNFNQTGAFLSDINSISGVLANRINLVASSAGGVTSLNGISGVLTLSPRGNISITTGAGNIYISGDTGAYSNFASVSNLETTGTSLQNQVTSIKNGTGVFLQSSNLNGLISTGSANLTYLTTGASGQFYPVSNPNQFIRSGDVNTDLNGLMSTGSANLTYATIANLNTTGSNSLNSLITLSGLIGGLSGQLNATGALLGNYYLNSNPSGYITGFNSGIYLTTGQTGQFYSVSNPNSFATSGNLNSLSGQFNITGFNLQSAINTLSGNLTNSGALFAGLSGQLNLTGSNLNNLINGLSGQLNISGSNLYLKSNPNQYVQSGNLTGYATTTNFNTFSGNQQSFITGISPTGLDTYYINYPLNFTSIPRVQTTVEVTGTIMYLNNIQNRSISGFTSIFSDIIQESGCLLHVYASINN